MAKQMFQLSPNVKMVVDPESESAMVYHSLYGNPRIVNKEGLDFLNLFKEPITIDEVLLFCDDDPKDIVKEFSDIFFIVEPGFNEKDFLNQQKKSHLALVCTKQTVDRMGLAISDSCNFGCTHCIHFQPSSDDGSVLPIYQKPVKQLNMSWETAKKCIDSYTSLMREQGKKKCRLHFGNAEPLINWPVISKALEYCYAFDDLNFDFAINTNLVLMNQEMAETFKKYNVRIATSLDGTEQANNAIRITKGSKGTFDRIMAKFDLLGGIDYPLDGFSITVTSGNFDLIDTDIIDLAAQRNMTSIAFDYDLVSLVGTPVQERVDKLIKLKKHANKYGIDFFGTWDSAFRNLTSESLLSGNHAFCAAVEGKSLEFNVDGSIKVCSHTTTEIGHVNDFEHIFGEDGGLFNMVKDRFPGTDEYCTGCAIEGPCGGQCHVTREVVARSIGEKRQYLFNDMCNFYRLITEALALEYIKSQGFTAMKSRQFCSL